MKAQEFFLGFCVCGGSEKQAASHERGHLKRFIYGFVLICVEEDREVAEVRRGEGNTSVCGGATSRSLELEIMPPSRCPYLAVLAALILSKQTHHLYLRMVASTNLVEVNSIRNRISVIVLPIPAHVMIACFVLSIC